MKYVWYIQTRQGIHVWLGNLFFKAVHNTLIVTFLYTHRHQSSSASSWIDWLVFASLTPFIPDMTKSLIRITVCSPWWTPSNWMGATGQEGPQLSEWPLCWTSSSSWWPPRPPLPTGPAAAATGGGWRPAAARWRTRRWRSWRGLQLQGEGGGEDVFIMLG